MMIWILIFTLALVVALVLALPLLRKADNEPRTEEIDFFKQQLADVEADLAKGTLTTEEAESAKLEISRRILRADKQSSAAVTQQAPPHLSRAAFAVTMLCVVGVSIGIYDRIGSATLPALPLKDRPAPEIQASNRPSQEAAEEQIRQNGTGVKIEYPDVQEGQPDYAELIEKLEETLLENPESAEGFRLLAQAYARINDYKKSWRALEQLAAIMENDAPAEVFANQAEMMIMAANGYISPEAEGIVLSALAKDPTRPRPRYYLGLAKAQRGEQQEALQIWAALLAGANPRASFVSTVREQIMLAADEIGVDPLEYLPNLGPDQAAIEAAEDMTLEERVSVIKEMVAGLDAKLEDEPDNLPGWLRLIRSYGVLRQFDNAKEAAERARTAFKDDKDAVLLIDKSLEKVIEEGVSE